MGIGPIPRSQIRNYATEHGILSRDEFEYFYRILRAMDDEYVTLANTREEQTTHIPIENVEATRYIIERAGRAKKERKLA